MDGLKLMLDRYHTVLGSLNVAEVGDCIKKMHWSRSDVNSPLGV